MQQGTTTASETKFSEVEEFIVKYLPNFQSVYGKKSIESDVSSALAKDFIDDILNKHHYVKPTGTRKCPLRESERRIHH